MNWRDEILTPEVLEALEEARKPRASWKLGALARALEAALVALHLTPGPDGEPR